VEPLARSEVTVTAEAHGLELPGIFREASHLRLKSREGLLEMLLSLFALAVQLCAVGLG
jgi:hypothetical protein